MKNIILALIVLFISYKSYSKELLTISITESCPKMCENQIKRGFVTDILDEALKLYDYQINFVSMPWARAVSSATNGEIDGIISPSKREAPKLIYPKMEIAIQAECFYGRFDDKWRPNGAESFVNRKTIVFKGWSFEEEYIRKLGEDIYYRTFTDFSIDNRYIDRILTMVKTKKVDSFWIEPIVFESFTNKNRHKVVNLIKKQGCILTQDLYVGLNPHRPKFSKKIADDFDRGIKELRKSGKLQEILDNYDISDWRK